MTTPRKANLIESMALGGAAASFAVNFTHPIVGFFSNLLCVVQSGNLASLHHFSGCGDN